MNYEFEREIGFINSQPSLAECLTSFPPVADTFQSSSIKTSTLSHSTLIPPPFEQTIPSLNPASHARHGAGGRPKPSPAGSRASPVPAGALQPPEYPWMKEKKAAKKTALPPASASAAAAAATGPACLGHKGQCRHLAPGPRDPGPAARGCRGRAAAGRGRGAWAGAEGARSTAWLPSLPLWLEWVWWGEQGSRAPPGDIYPQPHRGVSSGGVCLCVWGTFPNLWNVG